MKRERTISKQTKQNWLIDTAVLIGALLAGISGIYFLFLPDGGYQGGRNPAYGLIILFARETWHDVHLWGGILMILAVVVHFTIHWSWVTMMARRIWRGLTSSSAHFSRGAKINLAIDLFIALSFLVAAITGIYFLFLPSSYQGGRTLGWDPAFLFSRTTWDIIHTWAGTLMIVAASLHIFIHWRWIVNVTQRFFRPLVNPLPGLRPANSK